MVLKHYIDAYTDDNSAYDIIDGYCFFKKKKGTNECPHKDDSSICVRYRKVHFFQDLLPQNCIYNEKQKYNTVQEIEMRRRKRMI
jgi:hypothetical protein